MLVSLEGQFPLIDDQMRYKSHKPLQLTITHIGLLQRFKRWLTRAYIPTARYKVDIYVGNVRERIYFGTAWLKTKDIVITDIEWFKEAQSDRQ